MAMGKNKSAVVKYSGGEIQVVEVNSDGTKLTTPDTWKSLGYIQESTLKDVTEQENQVDETGNTVNTIDKERSVALSGLLMQSDKDTIDFLKEGCRGRYYAVYQKQGKVNGKNQEIFYGICTIKPQVEIASGTKRPPFEVSVLSNPADLVFGATGVAFPTGCKATAATITANQYYAIVETP